MTVTYDSSAKFMGESVTRFRDLLRQWRSSRIVSRAAALKRIEMDSRTAAALVDEAEVQKLFGFQEHSPGNQKYGATEAGEALLMASPLKAITRRQARAIIEPLLERCAAINKRNDLPFTVDRVWLFGSYAKGKEKVNDIDLVVETGRTALWSPTNGDRYIKMACEMGGKTFVYARYSPEHRAMRYIEQKLIYGDRKNPRVADNDIDTLKALACECQMVFDRKRGGLVSDKVLDRHPESKGRSKDIGIPRAMPQLNESGSLLPVSLNFIDMDDHETRKYDPIYRETGIYGVYKVDAISSRPSRRKSEYAAAQKWIESLGELDGRGRCALMYKSSETGEQTGILVERSIHEDRGRYHYVLDISDVYSTQRKIDLKAKFLIATKLVCAIGSDMEKISRHARTLELPCDVRIFIRETSTNRLAEELRSYLAIVMSDKERPWMTDFAKKVVDEVKVVLERDQNMTPSASLPAP